MHPEASKARFEAEIERLITNKALLEVNGWGVGSSQYPVLRISMKHRSTDKTMVFQFECSDWDEKPPSLSVVDPETGAVLPGDRWPKDTGRGHWHASGYSVNGGPFCCMPGIREYHTHASHVNDTWDNYRTKSGYALVDIVLKISTAFQNSNV